MHPSDAGFQVGALARLCSSSCALPVLAAAQVANIGLLPLVGCSVRAFALVP
jgi:hypothetical protein